MPTVDRSKKASRGDVGIVGLVVTLATVYMASQVLRNSIGVIAPNLSADLGLSAAQIGILSSAFFFSFAAVQLPLGVAIDSYGPKACMLVCTVIVVIGTLLFAWSVTPEGLLGARVLMGIGASCYLMAPLALYARRLPSDRFSAFAGWQLGIGSIGALLATAPLALLATAIGWRGTFVVMAAVMGIALWLILFIVRDDTALKPQSTQARQETFWQCLKGVRQALAIKSVPQVFFINMATYSSFVLIAGLWGGPYLSHIYGYDLTERGILLLVPAAAQTVGLIVWGRADRLFGNHKFPVLLGAGTTCGLLLFLAVAGAPSPLLLTVVLAIFGFCSAYTPVVIAHGKSLFPPHLAGRGMTLINMGSMGGVFLSQLITGWTIDLFSSSAGAYPLAAYRTVYALQAIFVLVAWFVYLGARDPLLSGSPPTPAARKDDRDDNDEKVSQG